MKDKSVSISEVEKRIKERREQERKAFFEENQRTNEMIQQEFKDRLDSGLLDIKKVMKYLELKKKRKIEKPEKKDIQRQMKLHSIFLSEIKKYRNSKLLCEPRPNLHGWLFNPNPLIMPGSTTWQSGPNQGGWEGGEEPDETWKNGSKVGHPTNKVKLAASAQGNIVLNENGIIEKVTAEYSEEEAEFYYTIPDELIPLPLGGTIKVSTTWIISGYYDAQYDPAMYDGIPSPTSEINLEVRAWLNVWDDSKGYLIPSGGKDVPGFPIIGKAHVKYVNPINEIGVPIQLFWVGPSVEYPVKPGGGPYKAMAGFRIICWAKGGVGHPPNFKQNVAKIDLSAPTDFSTGEIELETIRAEVVETPYYLVEQKKPPGVYEKLWEPKIKPDILDLLSKKY